MEKIELSIITVNFGSKDKVVNFYRSIVNFAAQVKWELIIVDNPTKSGGDGEFLAHYFSDKKNTHIVKLSQNLGYGEGNNEGVKFARGEFIAICNPDTEILNGTFETLLAEFRENLEIGIAVPILKTTSGDVLENCRNFPTIFSLIKRRISKQTTFVGPEISRKNETDWAQGSFWVLRKTIYDQLKGFDSRFFLFMEDIDFCRRIWQKKLKVVQVPKSIAIHSPNRLSGGFIGSAIFRKTFWIHLWSACLYFWKWR